jgi:hypothetical protein
MESMRDLNVGRTRRRRGARAVALGVAGATVFSSSFASANGRFPATNQLVIAPADPSFLVLRATFGILVSHDAGATWDGICESAVGFNGAEDPAVAVTSKGNILAGLYEGLSVSPDQGCSWGLASELSGWVSADVSVRRDDPHAAVTVAWVQSTDDAGLSTFANRVFETADDGAHWMPAGARIDPSALVQNIDLAPSNPQRIYVSGVHGIYETNDVPLFVSDDGGRTFAERPVPVNIALEAGAFLAAVDPSNPDRVYLRTSPISRLLVSDDAGRSFRAPLQFAGEMQGFALSPDGETIFAGGPSDGLWVGDAATLSFHEVSTLPIQCLAARDGALYACSDDSRFALGVSQDRGVSFTPLLRLEGIRGLLACPATSATAACANDFLPLCQALGGCNDAGPDPVDAGTSADAGSPSSAGAPSLASCSCATSGADPDSFAQSAGAILAIAGMLRIATRERRRKRRRSTLR